MTAKVLYIDEMLTPDSKACSIANKYVEWEMYRDTKKVEWDEIQRYIFATDTSKTGNNKLPWSNKTTIPKLCQIRDNLHSNYMATLFPKRKWLTWEGSSKSDETKKKKEAVIGYMAWVVDRNDFYSEVSKMVCDYIDYGNCFGTVEWTDQTSTTDLTKSGYVGPSIKRISPLDIVFNPTSTSFETSPKIVRSLISMGELADIVGKPTSTEEEREEALALMEYLHTVRKTVSEHATSNLEVKDAIYNVAGFSNFRDYLLSGYVEVLSFYGDIWNEHDGTFEKDVVIKIVDRHKIFYQSTNKTAFGSFPIFHTGWRIRPDNLWAMGPLDNLVGMQYRMDHLENMKADAVDLSAMPVFKIKGHVEEFEWAPMERIYIGDDGDVTLLHPPVQTVDLKTEIAILQQTMEEMAGSPRETMGFRTPGEKTMYEVQSMQNSAGRIFQAKTAQFERNQLENLLNAMLELARRKVDAVTIRILDDEFKVAEFKSLTNKDITGNGRIRPIAARNFAEKAQLVQNLTNFFGSAIGGDQDIKRHFSSIALARMFEEVLDVKEYNIVQDNIRISEQAEAERLVRANQEQLAMETQTPTGFLPGDHDPQFPEPTNEEVPVQ
jgi:hypothetical protein